jgi:hypothetical protein
MTPKTRKRIRLKLTQSGHLLIFIYIYIPHPSQSHSRLYNHQSACLSHSLLLLPFLWPIPTDIFSHRWKVKIFVSTVRNVVFL